VLDLIAAQPGITVPDLSRAIGVEPPSVYRIVRRLQQEGAITKEGKSLALG
jgi:DNA-binding IclR family transcriptional regulator